MLSKTAKFFIVGKGDVAEQAIAQALLAQDFENIFCSYELGIETSLQASVNHFFQQERPEYIILNSVQSGGIQANQDYPADFIYHNLQTQNNIFHAAWQFGIKKMLYISASCAYPKEAAQPMTEEMLLTGSLEKTSEPYSVAKISGIVMGDAFARQYQLPVTSIIPATIYGPGSDVDLSKAHVMGALIAKIVQAKEENKTSVDVWGSGNPRREFMFKEDFAQACLFLLENENTPALMNVGVGEDISIRELAELIKQLVGYSGELKFDASKPDGTMQKLLDNRVMKELGFTPAMKLNEGIKETIQWYQSTFAKS